MPGFPIKKRLPEVLLVWGVIAIFLGELLADELGLSPTLGIGAACFLGIGMHASLS